MKRRNTFGLSFVLSRRYLQTMIYNQERIMSSIAELVEYEVMSWPNVEKLPHRFGGIEFRVNGHEIGHLHANRQADLPFSVVFAGLIPRLLKEGKWCIPPFVPRERPFRALATSLLPLLESQMSETDLLMQIKKLAEPLQSGELSLFDIVDRILQKNTATRLLMYIDQF